jgi:F-type H+-transporting ATPase subunit a
MIHLFAAADSPHVSLAAEEIFNIAGLPITNSMITGILGYVVIIWFFWYIAGKVKRDEKNRFVSLVQWIFEALYRTVEQVMGDKEMTKRLAPFAIALFFFILLQYYVGILPFVGPVYWGETHLFRGLAADLNATFALAIITMATAQVYAIKKHGFRGNAKRYFRNPLKDPAGAFEGLLEGIAEFSRLTALSLRLFGNVFAGEVLLMMVAFLTVYFAPIALPPFLIFEIFIGGVQAYIFFMLTIVFISLGLASHGHEEHAEVDRSPATVKPKALAVGGNDG